ncbi:hypothetical protein FE782_22285 [Paenibacillus antri]|uniref:Lipoprotein n=1 Tax=Paenibacillus antri TaxID=2582848 RepID=A0A5R9G6T0_9BACL|nr:hypothetical protein [Paenibacillus antri]TLS50066.1 hypothetical protein FE782_22285 [Paenibacillus antri]
MHDKPKFTLTGAIIFLGIAILLGSCQISNAIKSTNYGPNYEDEFNMFNNILEDLVKTLEKNQ